MQPFAGNYGKDKRYQKTSWKCACGLALEQEEHLEGGECPVYGDIREEFPDTLGDNERLDFFTQVLERRKELEEEEQRSQVLAANNLAAGVASPLGQASV